jgi:hypothetical protein
VSYLRSVPDPYSAASPHYEWGPFTFDAARLARRLHVRPGDVEVQRAADGRVESVRIGSTAIDADTFRSRLGLASAWFEIGDLSLKAARQRVLFGGKIGLTAQSDGLGTATLQRRIGAGVWKTLARVRGSRSVEVEPQGATAYRLAADGVTGPVVSVQVAPRLRVVAAGKQLMTGQVEPVSRGPATVWRKVASGWRVVAHPQVDAQGRFSTPVRLRPGDYRVEVAATSRFASADASVSVTPRLLAGLR